MTRYLFAFSLLFAFAPLPQAQDMPLSQILIPGEGWKIVPNATKPNFNPIRVPAATDPTDAVTATIPSPDGGTRFDGFGKAAFLYAHALGANGKVLPGHPYAPLRTQHRERGICVTSLAADRDGRIYAATEIGVQVFDPTGRMCGVLTPAAPGLPQALAFEGDQLTLWIGDTKYTRTLRTTGVK